MDISRPFCYSPSQQRDVGVYTMEAYCMKCRAKREIKNPKKVILKNGRPATRGVCSVCGTKVVRMGES